MEKRSFNTRAFVALVIVASGLTLPVSGIANHVYQFATLTGARHCWMSVHNSLALLFTVFTVWHAVLNRRALLHHTTGIVGRVAAIRREAVTAFVLVALVAGLFVGHALHMQ